jgi:uncharacterized Fe-S center protein
VSLGADEIDASGKQVSYIEVVLNIHNYCDCDHYFCTIILTTAMNHS